MLELKKKSLVFTDIHFGLKSNSISRLNICVKVVKKIIETIKEYDVSNVIFLGDYMHDRNTANIQTLNVAYKCLKSIASKAKVYFIVGNHDIFYKNTTDVSSANIFRDIKNVTIIDKDEEVLINGKKCLFSPWLSDLTKYNKSYFDMLFGHFEISNEYLTTSFIEDNKNINFTSSQILQNLDNDELLNNKEFKLSKKFKKSSDLIGDWIKIVKEKGTIFSGHIHIRKEFSVKKRKFIFVGSPYQQNLGEINSKDGCYLLDENMSYKFIEFKEIPIHINLKMSEIMKIGIDKYNFSNIKGNIIHKIYDIEIDRLDDNKITQLVVDNMPYDELESDYDIDIKNNDNGVLITESIETLRKSKLEYLYSYLNNIDPNVLSENKLELNKLIDIMNEYYERVV